MRTVTAVERKGIDSAKTKATVVSDAPPSQARPSRYGDQIEIHHLLRNVFHGPSAAEFQAQLDAPGYDPQQRLIIRQGLELAAHVRYLPALMQYDTVELPIAWLMDLATAVQFRRQGLAGELIAAAEEHAANSGAVLGLVRTAEVDFFRKRGWGVCGQHSYSLVDACRLLATMEEARERRPLALLPPGRTMPLNVRPIRRLDLPEIMRLEAIRCRGSYGTFIRSETQWEWLLDRGACEEVYVAERGGTLRGYIIACEGRIAELTTEDSAAVFPLLAHVAHNAFENSKLALRFDAPPTDPTHRLCVAAGGRTVYQPVSGGEAYCVKVLRPQKLLELTSPVWKQRRSPTEEELVLELACDEGPRQIFQLHGSGKVTPLTTSSSRTRLQLSPALLGPLVLGQLTRSDQVREFSLAVAGKKAAALAAHLFPPLPLYFPAFDQLMAR
jgi:predicted acetyltransferase